MPRRYRVDVGGTRRGVRMTLGRVVQHIEAPQLSKFTPFVLFSDGQTVVAPGVCSRDNKRERTLDERRRHALPMLRVKSDHTLPESLSLRLCHCHVNLTAHLLFSVLCESST